MPRNILTVTPRSSPKVATTSELRFVGYPLLNRAAKLMAKRLSFQDDIDRWNSILLFSGAGAEGGEMSAGYVSLRTDGVA